jgi:hypothetical protein
MDEKLPSHLKPMVRREFLVTTGGALALTALPKLAHATPGPPRRPPEGVPEPLPKALMELVPDLKKPPAPFTLVDFDRNPFQRPLGAAFQIPELPDPGRAPKHGKGVDDDDDKEKEKDKKDKDKDKGKSAVQLGDPAQNEELL